MRRRRLWVNMESLVEMELLKMVVEKVVRLDVVEEDELMSLFPKGCNFYGSESRRLGGEKKSSDHFLYNNE